MPGVLALVASSCYGLDTRFGPELVEPALARDWRLAITLTPTAARWLETNGELARLAELTDLPVRSVSRLPTQPRPHPQPDAFVFAPASANSIAKLALGIADNQALTVLGDVLGIAELPIVIGYAAHSSRYQNPGWRRHLADLRSVGANLHQLSKDRPWTELLDQLPCHPRSLQHL